MEEFIYEIYGVVLKSNISFPEIGTIEEYSKPDIIFDFIIEQQADYTGYKWLYQCNEEKFGYRLARRESDFIVCFPNLADFRFSSDMEWVYCYSSPDIPRETIGHLLLDQIIPLILSVRGKIILHASAVVIPAGAIVFIGESGHGKSTLSAGFGQQGYPILTDDCLLLEQQGNRWIGISSYPGLRLWPESLSLFFNDVPSLPKMAHYSDKRRLGINDSKINFFNGRIPVANIYSLASAEMDQTADNILIQPLGPADSLVELAKSCFSLDIKEAQKLSKYLQKLGQVVRYLGSVNRLYYPRDLSMLPKVLKAVLEHSCHKTGITI